MNTSGKVIAAIVVVLLLAGALLFAQRSTSKPGTVKLSTQDMEMLVKEMLPPTAQQQLADKPEEKKMFVKRIKELLALANAAERDGLGQDKEGLSQIELQTDIALRDAYEKKNPGSTPSDADINAYYQANPKVWDNFLELNPQLTQQAQSAPAQLENIKKRFGQIKVLAERGRQSGLLNERATQLRVLIGRSQVLASAYVSNLQKNPEKLVTDADVEKYYSEHPEEFDEVHARHILISTEAPEEPAAEGDKGKKADKPKALSKDEARSKAQAILERIRKGEDFAKLAGEFSDDPGSKTNGGDLDFYAKGGGFVKPFEDALFTIKPGEVSDLVETQFGYHIIKVEERRVAAVDDPQTKQKIRQKLQEEKLEQHFEELVVSSGVEVAEDFTITPDPIPPQDAPVIPMPQGNTPPPPPPSAKKPAGK